MMRRTSLAVLASAVVVTATSTHGQTKRFVTEKDLLRFTWIADPQISPDGSTVAFVRVTVNEKENRVRDVGVRGGGVGFGISAPPDVGNPRYHAALVAGRQTDRVCRHAAREADPLLQPARFVGDGRTGV